MNYLKEEIPPAEKSFFFVGYQRENDLQIKVIEDRFSRTKIEKVVLEEGG